MQLTEAAQAAASKPPAAASRNVSAVLPIFLSRCSVCILELQCWELAALNFQIEVHQRKCRAVGCTRQEHAPADDGDVEVGCLGHEFERAVQVKEREDVLYARYQSSKAVTPKMLIICTAPLQLCNAHVSRILTCLTWLRNVHCRLDTTCVRAVSVHC